jgi:hypothetical protein
MWLCLAVALAALVVSPLHAQRPEPLDLAEVVVAFGASSSSAGWDGGAALVLDLGDGSTAPGSSVTLQRFAVPPLNGYSTQDWQVQRFQDSSLSLVSLYSRLCLDIALTPFLHDEYGNRESSVSLLLRFLD